MQFIVLKFITFHTYVILLFATPEFDNKAKEVKFMFHIFTFRRFPGKYSQANFYEFPLFFDKTLQFDSVIYCEVKFVRKLLPK